MNYKPLGRSGLQVSTVGLGCNNFGMRIDKDQTQTVVDKAIELRHQLLRHRQHLRRHPLRGVPRRRSRRPAQGHRPRHQVRRPRRRLRPHQGRLPTPHHAGLPRLPPAPRHRLDRPLPDPLPRPGHAHRRDAARARRPRPRRQGELHRLLQLQRLADRRGPVDLPQRAPEPHRLRPERVQPPRPARREGGRARGQRLRTRRSFRTSPWPAAFSPASTSRARSRAPTPASAPGARAASRCSPTATSRC